MIQEEVIQYYKDELGMGKLVYKHMNRFVLLSYFIFYMASVFIGLYLTFFSNQQIYAYICLAICLIILVIINQHNKRIIKKVYGISKQELIWGGKEFERQRFKKLESYIKQRIGSNEQLEKLIHNLKNEIEYKSNYKFLISGLGLALLIPLWNNLISSSFKDQLMPVVFSRSILFLISAAGLILIVSSIKFIFRDIFYRDITKIKELIRYLDAILLDRIHSGEIQITKKSKK
ncbi:hypothetical protein [Paenibacillus sp. FJAT-26967]|uniref:hypothetical protein n=1 Tax=Paenibacillus sp. FJAT-26967 TaxID=1729690 RepID=UPI000838A4F1|nr:hypothetical protein [Paenibacillus sp. FJAT-26967]